MENIILRHCKKCGRGTLQEKRFSVREISGFSYGRRDMFPKGKRGDTLYRKHLEEVDKKREEWKKGHTKEYYYCTGCGKEWIEGVVKRYEGGVLEDCSYFEKEYK